MYRDRRPDDRGYFETLTRVIFQGGLNWNLIAKKWPNFRRGFRDFTIAAVAAFDDGDVERLMQDAGIVRNRAKIIATINNAKQLQTIREEHGTFQKYLDSLDKSENYAHVVKELAQRFSRLGPASARIFLYSVGENIIHEG
jgi:DNA-3-methyladenine glycosylase I